VEAFRSLKELLTTTQILKFSDMDEDFLVCTNTSMDVLGEVLKQYHPMIAYISRKLRKHEDKFVMHDFELLAIMYSLRVWRHYLI